MAFMIPEYLERRAWHIDGPQGLRPFFAATPFDAAEALDQDAARQWFADLLEEPLEDVWSVERDEGPRHYVRLSAPGYMDATEWSGPYETEAEARRYLEETEEVDPDTGDSLLDPDEAESG